MFTQCVIHSIRLRGVSMGLFHDCETLNFVKGCFKLYFSWVGVGWVLLAGGVSGNPQYLLFICILSVSEYRAMPNTAKSKGRHKN